MKRELRRRKKQAQSGSALIAALCLIFIAGMLTGTVLLLTQISTFDIAAHIALQKSTYLNEGMSNRIQWLIAADRSLYPDRNAGQIDYTEYDTDRFMADGIVHEMDYHGTTM